MDDNADIFWENVKKEIKLQNTTQEWVAKKSGIALSTFQGWMRKSIYPRADEAVCIANSLNTSVECLVNGIGRIGGDKKTIGVLNDHVIQIQNHLDVVRLALKGLE
jgi:transcriptional regulator with XRE-family HTH domain